MFGGWIILQAGNPVTVELVDDGVDAVALQPSIAQRPIISWGRFAKKTKGKNEEDASPFLLPHAGRAIWL